MRNLLKEDFRLAFKPETEIIWYGTFHDMTVQFKTNMKVTIFPLSRGDQVLCVY